MAASSLTIPPAAAKAARIPFELPGWLQEPLLHFAVLGAVLFGVDYLLARGEADPSVIVIDAAVDAEARRIFTEARGREPNEDELLALRRVWLDNEVLYREGLAMRLDEGDPAIRERVIFKALSVLDAGLERPPVDDAALRDWFEANRGRYDEPARFDFEEAVLAGGATDADVRAFVHNLNGGTPGDAEAGLRVFTGRPHENLVQSYGPYFAESLEAATDGAWHALQSAEGLRAVRLVGVTPPRPADFEQLRGVILQDWIDATMAEQRSAAVGVLAKKYTVQTGAQ